MSEAHIFPFQVIDPNEPHFWYEVSSDPRGRFPQEVAEDLIGARFDIGAHNVGTTIGGRESDKEAYWNVYLGLGRLIVQLESSGRLVAADYFIARAAKEDWNTRKEIYFLEEGVLQDKDSGQEINAANFIAEEVEKQASSIRRQRAQTQVE